MAAKPSHAQLLETARAYIDAQRKGDPDAIKALTSSTFVSRTGPSSLKVPPKTRDEYYDFQVAVFKQLTWDSATIEDIIVDVESRKTTVYLLTKATTAAGPYEAELVITLTMTEDGKLIENQYDFLDSHVWVQWGETVQKWMQGN